MIPSSKSLWRRLWEKVGLDQHLAKSMFKNALPSTAALWVIQSRRLGQTFDTVGFLPIVITILMTPSLPRIPYLRSLIYTIFMNCVMLCITLLAAYCSTQARLHTTPSGGSLSDYNSSAAVVSGIWLFFAVWALQTFRTYYPHHAKSIVLCTIFTEVSIVTASELPDMTSVITFSIQLFEMFLLGYAFSALASLFIFPQSSRDVTSADIKKIFDLSHKATSPEVPFGGTAASHSSTPFKGMTITSVESLSRAFAKLQIDISDAKKDIGWSRFSPSNFNELIHHFRLFIIPLRGLFAVDSIRTNLHFGTQTSQFDQENALKDPVGVDSSQRWDFVFEKLQEPMKQLQQLTDEAIDHCQIALHMTGSRNSKQTVATSRDSSEDSQSEKGTRELPGGADFVAHFDKRTRQQKITLRSILGLLREQDEQIGPKEHIRDTVLNAKPHSPTASHGRLLFTLYIEYLYNGILASLLELLILCDSRFMTSHRKLQLPGKKRFLKLLRRLIDHHHIGGDLEDIASEIPQLVPQRSRMSEPIPQKTSMLALSRLNNYLDKPFQVFGSSQSFFGFRVACAVMSITIVGFLARTNQWFFNQRGIWAAIFIPFSMAPSSGEAKSMLIYRVIGSLLSIPISLVNWYIVAGKPAGVIVIYFVFAFIQQYFLLKFPQWGSFWRPCLITYSIIVGYSLQERYSDVPQPPATTTHSFPVYLIGPYRCLTTLVGVAVAFIWTVFPQPTSANSVMRRRLGQSLFCLAEYHSCMHLAVSSWASGHQGDMLDKTSIAHQLMKVRHRLFAKETATLAVIRDQYKFAGFDLTLSGARPEHRYVTIADEIDRIMSYMNVVIFVSAHFHSHISSQRAVKDIGPWETGAVDLLAATKSTARQIASLIHILASSVTNDQPLPPLLEAPESFAVARKLSELRPDLMSIENVDEEGYKAFAVIEISVAMMTKSLDNILQVVKEMVGEVGVGIELDKDK